MTEIKNNLFGIKWPTGVDMPLNKTQTQTQTYYKDLKLRKKQQQKVTDFSVVNDYKLALKSGEEKGINFRSYF